MQIEISLSACYSTTNRKYSKAFDNISIWFQGTPYPRQEHNAIDAVIQYAINELEFEVEEIVLFGWSIGGYASTWAAINYPDIRGLVSQFQHIEHLNELLNT